VVKPKEVGSFFKKLPDLDKAVIDVVKPETVFVWGYY
jgi:hypothetical protein